MLALADLRVGIREPRRAGGIRTVQVRRISMRIAADRISATRVLGARILPTLHSRDPGPAALQVRIPSVPNAVAPALAATVTTVTAMVIPDTVLGTVVAVTGAGTTVEAITVELGTAVMVEAGTAATIFGS